MSKKFPDALVGDLGFKVPESTVDRVARGTWFHALLQALPVETAMEGILKRKDFAQCSLGGFAVARIGNAFATSGDPAPFKLSGTYLCHNHHGFCLRAAADGEAAGDRPALDPGGEF